jgi:hypothetical protein
MSKKLLVAVSEPEERWKLRSTHDQDSSSFNWYNKC